MDPFETLGIARTFDIDLAAVERTHRDLSRALHPDRYVAASPTERRAALGKAIEVNEAWRIVRDPLRRAEALLALNGVAVGEDREPPGDPEFLADMLEQREALAEARSARDLQAVRRLAHLVQQRLRDAEAELSRGFARGEVRPLLKRLGEARFYRRFLDEVSAIEDELAA
ncbi:MAG TPA: Fe-S protein assembly co-chaperone HscB [Polyangiaceae bacterium]|nr:Fe-S protein assembly co-chaperone HscB [Polyangiaceae bacterium]